MLTNEQIAVMYGAAQDQNRTGIPPSVHLARAVEAATLATVTPLVQQLAIALDTCDEFHNHEGWNQCYSAPDVEAALTAARAFLSGATKGEPL